VKDQLESLVDQMIEHNIEYSDAVSEFEKRFIKRMLEKNNWNHSRTAKALGIHRNSLSRKVEGFNLDHRGPRRRRTASR
jgi:transcriptional regulator with PAS, ATPase and Fis domain